MNRFKKEQYIIQRQGKNGWSFLVRIRGETCNITKTFREKDYPTTRTAFDSAIQFRDKSLYEISCGTAMRQNNATVQDMFDAFIESTPLSFETKRKHTIFFNKYVLHKDKKIQELTRADIIEDLNRMVDTASDGTISKVLSIYRNDVIEMALMKDIICKDPSLGVRKPQSHLILSKRDHSVDRDTILEVEKLIRGTVQNHYNARLMVMLIELLYYTGMRPAEALALTKDDIKPNYISITKELGSSSDDINVVRRCKTPDSVRNIPIHPNLKPILEDLLEYSRYDNLFFKDDGHYMDSNWVGNIISRVCKKSGIEFNLYRLRHNFATQLVTNKVDQKTTIEMLGHANYDMSLYYASSNNELKEEAIGLIH